MISDSVELCETEVCFLNIQLIGTNVWLPKIQVHLNQNIEIILFCTGLCFPPLVWWMYEIKRAPYEQVCLQNMKYRAYECEPNSDIFPTILWANSRNMSNWSMFFFFKMMVIQAWRCDFIQVLSFCIRKFAISFHTFLGMTFHIVGKRGEIHRFSEHGNFSFAPTEIRGSIMVLYLSTISLLISHRLWVQPKYTWSRNDVGSPKSTSLLSTFHIGFIFCFFPAN